MLLDPREYEALYCNGKAVSVYTSELGLEGGLLSEVTVPLL